MLLAAGIQKLGYDFHIHHTFDVHPDHGLWLDARQISCAPSSGSKL